MIQVNNLCSFFNLWTITTRIDNLKTQPTKTHQLLPEEWKQVVSVLGSSCSMLTPGQPVWSNTNIVWLQLHTELQGHPEDPCSIPICFKIDDLITPVQIHNTYWIHWHHMLFCSVLFLRAGNLSAPVLMYCSRIAIFFIYQDLFVYFHITLKKTYRIASLEYFLGNLSFFLLLKEKWVKISHLKIMSSFSSEVF